MSQVDRSKPVLSCKNLHKYLGVGVGRVHVLRGVGVELFPGRMYSIVGPSGCGKSTLLYLLGLLDRPDDGEIWVGGQDMGKTLDEERTQVRNESIGFVFQFHFLLAEFTALENLMLPMRKREAWTEKQMREKAQSLLDEVGLGDKGHRLANELSGGEQQRVAVARALANEPDVIFADEPTGNLDVRNSTMVFDLLRRLCHDHGQAVLMVTHNVNLAKKCDEVLAMQDGEFVDAPPTGDPE